MGEKEKPPARLGDIYSNQGGKIEFKIEIHQDKQVDIIFNFRSLNKFIDN